MKVLVINCGSSSLKYQLIDMDGDFHIFDFFDFRTVSQFVRQGRLNSGTSGFLTFEFSLPFLPPPEIF